MSSENSSGRMSRTIINEAPIQLPASPSLSGSRKDLNIGKVFTEVKATSGSIVHESPNRVMHGPGVAGQVRARTEGNKFENHGKRET